MMIADRKSNKILNDMNNLRVKLSRAENGNNESGRRNNNDKEVLLFFFFFSEINF